MIRWIGGVFGIALVGALFDQGDAVPKLEVFRWIFVVLTGAAGLSGLASTMVHRFAPDEDHPGPRGMMPEAPNPSKPTSNAD